MIAGRGNDKRTSAARGGLGTLSRAALGIWAVGMLPLVGCGEAPPAGESTEAPVATTVVANDKVAEAIRRVLAADKAERAARQAAAQPEQPIDQQAAAEPAVEQVAEQRAAEPAVEPGAEEPVAQPATEHVADDTAEPTIEVLAESEYFCWTPPKEPEPAAETEATVEVVAQDSPELTMPEIAEEVGPQAREVAAVEEAAPEVPPQYVTTPFADLLPPQMAPAVAETKSSAAVGVPQEQSPELNGLSEAERRIVEQVFRETSETATGALTDARVNELATASIREANALANRGAHFAARQKLVEALRMISQAKDANQGDRTHSAALAAGLRALEEAHDFAPRGTQLEGEMDVAVIVAAHRTPIAKRLKTTDVPPRLVMDLYFRYAQLKLAAAVAPEPSGSMSLYALGKVTSQIGRSAPDKNRLAHRQAVAYQQAALLAHNQNYFAAHELGVLLAESGRLTDAEHLLKQVAARQPNPTVYRNLASVEQRLGKSQLAAHNRALATQMAARQSSAGRQVEWVGPEAFGGSSITPTQYAGSAPPPGHPGFTGDRTAMFPPPRNPQQHSPTPPGRWR